MADRSEDKGDPSLIDIASDSDALAAAADVVGQGGGPVLVRRGGVPIAAVVSLADLARWRAHDQVNIAAEDALVRIGAAFADMPLDELGARVTETVEQVRAERRHEADARRSA